MIEGYKKLTGLEIKHLTENNCNDTKSFQRALDYQEKLRKIPPHIEPCYQCKLIAKKLGIIGDFNEE